MPGAVVSILLAATLAASAFVADSQGALNALVGATFSAEVVGVTDGDTIEVKKVGTRSTFKVRLDGIDTPERGEPFSQHARNFTRVMLFGQTASVEGRDVDRYGRLVARVRIDSKDTSVELVRGGLACHYRRYSSDPVLEDSERVARSAGVGFWAPGAEKPACVARASGEDPSVSRPVASVGQVIGNVNSKVYHAPTCRNARCKNCTMMFQTREDADKAGYRPAGDCLRTR